MANADVARRRRAPAQARLRRAVPPGLRRRHLRPPRRRRGARRRGARGVPDAGSELPALHQQVRRGDVRQRALHARRSCAATRCSTTRSKGNCAKCHVDVPGPGGRPAQFTDYGHVALGVPRNPEIAGQPRPALLRPRPVRPGAQGPGRRAGVLRHVQDAHAAQRAPAARCSSTTAASTRWTTCCASIRSATPTRPSGTRASAARSSRSTTCRRAIAPTSTASTSRSRASAATSPCSPTPRSPTWPRSSKTLDDGWSNESGGKAAR